MSLISLSVNKRSYSYVFSSLAGAIATVNSLNAKNAREHWEKEFNTHYIQPILGDLNAEVNKAMDLVVNDNPQGLNCRLKEYITIVYPL